MTTLFAKKAFVSAAAAMALCVAAVAMANARPNTSSYTCDDLKALISAKGAVVLNTRTTSRYQVYGRYVANRSYCASDEVLLGFKVPSKTSSCRLKLCIKSDND
ncbi:MAG: hypothetical protein ABJM29_16540 [Rhizobiaceae bacterium]